MKNFLIFVLLLVVLGGALFIKFENNLDPIVVSPTPTPTATPSPTAPAFDQSVSDGTITLSYRSTEFGVATTPSQVLVTPNIPPCSPTFNYCLYYTGAQYQGSNFQSAGLRIQKRTDISSERLCLATPPAGFRASTTPKATSSKETYTTSVFSPVGDAAAGSYTTGSLYRLFLKDGLKCYEFETRIGQSQFKNYPPGSIKEFTASDQTVVDAQFRDILTTITLKNGTTVAFPPFQ